MPYTFYLLYSQSSVGALSDLSARVLQTKNSYYRVEDLLGEQNIWDARLTFLQVWVDIPREIITYKRVNYTERGIPLVNTGDLDSLEVLPTIESCFEYLKSLGIRELEVE